MSIRPIDMQVALPRVTEVKESKSASLHREDISHDNANKSMREETVKRQKSVNKMDAGSNVKVNREKKNQEEKEKKKKREDKRTELNKADDEDRMNGPYHSIDIKI